MYKRTSGTKEKLYQALGGGVAGPEYPSYKLLGWFSGLGAVAAPAGVYKVKVELGKCGSVKSCALSSKGKECAVSLPCS